MAERHDEERGASRFGDWRNEGRLDRDWRDENARPRERPVFGERESGASYGGARQAAGFYQGAPRREFEGEAGRYGGQSHRGATFGGPDYGPDYGAYGYDRPQRPAYGRGPLDRASDEMASWFGNHEAEHRREADLSHRGRGPEGYRRTDARISEDVHDRLTEDPRLDARYIQVAVADGEVTLSGKVIDRASKHRAEHDVEDIAGVSHVQNNLRVDTDLPRAQAPLGENATLARQARGDD